jgi:hypothetical protein
MDREDTVLAAFHTFRLLIPSAFFVAQVYPGFSGGVSSGHRGV